MVIRGHYGRVVGRFRRLDPMLVDVSQGARLRIRKLVVIDSVA